MDSRYAGSLGEEYELLKLALPDHDDLQQTIGNAVATFLFPSQKNPLSALEIGCGDGYTTRAVLDMSPHLSITAIDSSLKMVERARHNLSDIPNDNLSIIESDALALLQNAKPAHYHLVFSALTLHNFESVYREAVIREIFKVLIPGGLFINGDKYVGNEEERFAGLQKMVKNFFTVYLPLGKLELLEDLVLHNIADQAPNRVMRQSEAIVQLSDIGFNPVSVIRRYNMKAVLTAHKPR